MLIYVVFAHSPLEMSMCLLETRERNLWQLASGLERSCKSKNKQKTLSHIHGSLWDKWAGVSGVFIAGDWIPPSFINVKLARGLCLSIQNWSNTWDGSKSACFWNHLLKSKLENLKDTERGHKHGLYWENILMPFPRTKEIELIHLGEKTVLVHSK